jgi:hypothetical protein
MARNRVIYQSEALYVSADASSTSDSDHKQLHRVQSANYNFSISRTDINQYGQVGRLDSVVLESPTVGVDFSYLLHDGTNETNLGFADSTDFGSSAVGFLSGHFSEGSGRNLYIITAPEGRDINIDPETSTDGYGAIGIGNSYVTEYSLEASVGSLPTVSVSMEGLNMNADAAVSGSSAGFSGITSPAVNRENGTSLTDLAVLPASSSGTIGVTALRPGDIVIDFDTAASSATKGPIASIGSDANAAHIQSISLSASVSRSPIERIGSRFAYARPADFPVTSTLSINAIMNEVTAASLNEIIDDEVGSDITITFKKPDNGDDVCKYKLINAKLDSESISSSIGSNKSVDLTFSTSIGGPKDTTNNILFSGSA